MSSIVWYAEIGPGGRRRVQRVPHGFDAHFADEPLAWGYFGSPEQAWKSPLTEVAPDWRDRVEPGREDAVLAQIAPAAASGNGAAGSVTSRLLVSAESKRRMLDVLDGARSPIGGRELAAQLDTNVATIARIADALRSEGVPIRAAARRGFWLDREGTGAEGPGVARAAEPPSRGTRGS